MNNDELTTQQQLPSDPDPVAGFPSDEEIAKEMREHRLMIGAAAAAAFGWRDDIKRIYYSMCESKEEAISLPLKTDPIMDALVDSCIDSKGAAITLKMMHLAICAALRCSHVLVEQFQETHDPTLGQGDPVEN